MLPDVIESMADLKAALLLGVTDWKKYGEVYTRTRGDLILFNYLPSAQYERRWNWFERVSRGLILNRLTGEVVARPFDKFYNWGEGERQSEGSLLSVSEKLDGSLGILYREGDQYRIATRGSFDGEQAEWATEHLRRNHNLSRLPPIWTLLFEIIYPDNRIVVDYGARAELVLLAARTRDRGWYAREDQADHMGRKYGFARPRRYDVQSAAEILELLPSLTANEEGFVAVFSDGQRFKFKGDAYTTLHKLISGLSYGAVLEAHQAGTLDEFIGQIPDEFLEQVREWRATIEVTLAETRRAVAAALAAAPKDDRKTFALWVKANHPQLSPMLFSALDGRDITPIIYRFLKHPEEVPDGHPI